VWTVFLVLFFAVVKSTEAGAVNMSFVQLLLLLLSTELNDVQFDVMYEP